MPEVEMAQWYVVYAKPHKEEFAQFHLQLKGLGFFFRVFCYRNLPRSESDSFPYFQTICLSGLIFFEESHYVVWSPGVKRFTSFDGAPAPIEGEFVTFLKRQGSPEGIITARSNLKAGQEIQITGGPYRGTSRHYPGTAKCERTGQETFEAVSPDPTKDKGRNFLKFIQTALCKTLRESPGCDQEFRIGVKCDWVA